MSDELKPTNEGMKMVKHWIACKQSVDDANRRLRQHECALENAKNALGKWLVPDQETEDVFVLAYEATFIEVKNRHADVSENGGERSKVHGFYGS